MSLSTAPAVTTREERAALSRLAKATPKFRREERRASPCVRIVFANGEPVASEVVAAAPEQETLVAAVNAVLPAPAKAAKAPAAPTAPKAVSTRSAVRVTIGERVAIFSSLYVAFVELGLPVNKHVKFRKFLKIEGKKTFVCERGAHHVFETL